MPLNFNSPIRQAEFWDTLRKRVKSNPARNEMRWQDLVGQPPYRPSVPTPFPLPFMPLIPPEAPPWQNEVPNPRTDTGPYNPWLGDEQMVVDPMPSTIASPTEAAAAQQWWWERGRDASKGVQTLVSIPAVRDVLKGMQWADNVIDLPTKFAALTKWTARHAPLTGMAAMGTAQSGGFSITGGLGLGALVDPGGPNERLIGMLADEQKAMLSDEAQQEAKQALTRSLDYLILNDDGTINPGGMAVAVVAGFSPFSIYNLYGAGYRAATVFAATKGASTTGKVARAIAPKLGKGGFVTGLASEVGAGLEMAAKAAEPVSAYLSKEARLAHIAQKMQLPGGATAKIADRILGEALDTTQGVWRAAGAIPETRVTKALKIAGKRPFAREVIGKGGAVEYKPLPLIGGLEFMKSPIAATPQLMKDSIGNTTNAAFNMWLANTGTKSADELATGFAQMWHILGEAPDTLIGTHFLGTELADTSRGMLHILARETPEFGDDIARAALKKIGRPNGEPLAARLPGMADDAETIAREISDVRGLIRGKVATHMDENLERMFGKDLNIPFAGLVRPTANLFLRVNPRFAIRNVTNNVLTAIVDGFYSAEKPAELMKQFETLWSDPRVARGIFRGYTPADLNKMTVAEEWGTGKYLTKLFFNSPEWSGRQELLASMRVSLNAYKRYVQDTSPVTIKMLMDVGVPGGTARQMALAMPLMGTDDILKIMYADTTGAWEPFLRALQETNTQSPMMGEVMNKIVLTAKGKDDATRVLDDYIKACDRLMAKNADDVGAGLATVTVAPSADDINAAAMGVTAHFFPKPYRGPGEEIYNNMLISIHNNVRDVLEKSAIDGTFSTIHEPLNTAMRRTRDILDAEARASWELPEAQKLFREIGEHPVPQIQEASVTEIARFQNGLRRQVGLPEKELSIHTLSENNPLRVGTVETGRAIMRNAFEDYLSGLRRGGKIVGEDYAAVKGLIKEHKWNEAYAKIGEVAPEASDILTDVQSRLMLYTDRDAGYLQNLIGGLKVSGVDDPVLGTALTEIRRGNLQKAETLLDDWMGGQILGTSTWGRATGLAAQDWRAAIGELERAGTLDVAQAQRLRDSAARRMYPDFKALGVATGDIPAMTREAIDNVERLATRSALKSATGGFMQEFGDPESLLRYIGQEDLVPGRSAHYLEEIMNATMGDGGAVLPSTMAYIDLVGAREGLVQARRAAQNIPEGAFTRGAAVELEPKVVDALNATRFAGTEHATRMRDFTLINYSASYGYENFLRLWYMFPKWYIGTYPRWAIRMLNDPEILRAYLYTKSTLEQTQQEYPIQYRGMINAANYALNLDAMANPVYGMTQFFYEPETRKNWFSNIVRVSQEPGLSVLPWWTLGAAAAMPDASKSWASVFPWSGSLRTGTAALRTQPWMQENFPQVLESIPVGGLDVESVTRSIVNLFHPIFQPDFKAPEFQSVERPNESRQTAEILLRWLENGDIDEGLFEDALYNRGSAKEQETNSLWNRAKDAAIAKRILPELGGYLTGVPMYQVGPEERSTAAMWNDWYTLQGKNLKGDEYDAAYQELLQKYPWMPAFKSVYRKPDEALEQGVQDKGYTRYNEIREGRNDDMAACMVGDTKCYSAAWAKYRQYYDAIKTDVPGFEFTTSMYRTPEEMEADKNYPLYQDLLSTKPKYSNYMPDDEYWAAVNKGLPVYDNYDKYTVALKQWEQGGMAATLDKLPAWKEAVQNMVQGTGAPEEDAWESLLPLATNAEVVKWQMANDTAYDAVENAYDEMYYNATNDAIYAAYAAGQERPPYPKAPSTAQVREWVKAKYGPRFSKMELDIAMHKGLMDFETAYKTRTPNKYYRDVLSDIWWARAKQIWDNGTKEQKAKLNAMAYGKIATTKTAAIKKEPYTASILSPQPDVPVIAQTFYEALRKMFEAGLLTQWPPPDAPERYREGK